MFSEKIYAEIARVTRDALNDVRSRRAIDQVTVILGHVQMSSRDVVCYDAELRAAIARLMELARAEKRQEPTDALEALVQQMDRERGT